MTYRSNKAEAKNVVSAIAGMGGKAVALQLDASNPKTFDDFAVPIKQLLQDIWQTEQFDFLFPRGLPVLPYLAMPLTPR